MLKLLWIWTGNTQWHGGNIKHELQLCTDSFWFKIWRGKCRKVKTLHGFFLDKVNRKSEG